MIEDCHANGKDSLVPRTFNHFPEHFKGDYYTKYQKGMRWWKQREAILRGIRATTHTLSSAGFGKKSVVVTKALPDRGRKEQPWVTAVHKELVEFFHFKKAGMKMSQTIVGTMACHVIKCMKKENLRLFLDKKGKEIKIKITKRWNQRFCEKHSIVTRAQKGKLQLSPKKEEYIEKTVAYHMGVLKRGFFSGRFNEDLIENMDETHVIVNMENKKTLGFRGDEVVKYADVAGGGESMPLMVRLTGGVNARIESPMIIFANKLRSYHIKGLHDDIPGVCYRTGPKGWNDKTVFPQWIAEPRSYQGDRGGREKVIFVDSCGGHNMSEELNRALLAKRTILEFFPPCATHLVHPVDSFVIAKIKEVWSRKWEDWKMKGVESHKWSLPKGKKWSGKLVGPGKAFFLKLARDSIREVNEMKDKNGMGYARKAIIQCGLSLKDGKREESMLTVDLQIIIMKWRNHFVGDEVPPPSVPARDLLQRLRDADTHEDEANEDEANGYEDLQDYDDLMDLDTEVV